MTPEQEKLITERENKLLMKSVLISTGVSLILTLIVVTLMLTAAEKRQAVKTELILDKLSKLETAILTGVLPTTVATA